MFCVFSDFPSLFGSPEGALFGDFLELFLFSCENGDLRFLTPLCSGISDFSVWDLPESQKNVKKRASGKS